MNRTLMAILGTAVVAAGWVTAAVAARSKGDELKLKQGQLEASRRQARALSSEVSLLKRHRCPAPPSAEPTAPAPVPPAPAPKAIPIPPPVETPEGVARLQAQALDPAQTPERRVAALRDLRRVEGGRTRLVAESLLGILDTLQDPELRADILRHLHRAVPADLKGPILRRLRTDGDRRVREEAAETLGPLKEDPEVRAALDHASRTDADERVREQASKSLAGRK